MRKYIFISLVFIAVNSYARDLVISIPDNIEAEVLQKFSESHGWTSDNPQNRIQFSISVLKRFIRESIKKLDAAKAASNARKQSDDDHDSRLGF